MKIEKIEIKEVQDKGNLKAYVKATINDLSISDMKIVEGQNGLFVSMPSREYFNAQGEKKYSSIVYLTKEQSNELNKAVLSKYNGDNGQAVKQESEDTPYIDFGASIELTDDDIAF